MLIFTFGMLFFLSSNQELAILQPTVEEVKTPLLAYTFDNLKKTDIPGSTIELGPDTDETDDFISQYFYFNIPESPGSENLKKVSGLANIPKEPGNYPVIVMLRGFIPEDSFISGAGSQPTASVLASDGFITLAPDFLGFGESDNPSDDSFESRFQTYITVVALLSTLR